MFNPKGQVKNEFKNEWDLENFIGLKKKINIS